MKKIILATAITFGALALIGCQSTSNSPAPASSTNTVCTNGTQVVNGQTIACNTGGYGYTVGPNGQPIPYGGTQGSAGGCSYWTYVYQMYGAYYVPMIDGISGQLECVNIGQTNYQYISQNYPQYNWNSPMYGYCPYAYSNPAACGGSYYYGSPGYNTGYNNGSGICLGIGSSSGDDYGNDSIFGGICF